MNIFDNEYAYLLMILKKLHVRRTPVVVIRAHVPAAGTLPGGLHSIIRSMR